MQLDTSLYRSRRAELGSTFSRLLVNSFDAEPGEAVCSYYDDIRQVLPGNISPAFLWKLRFFLEDSLKNSFCIFWALLKIVGLKVIIQTS